MSEAARSRRDDARYEPQFGTSAGVNAAASDPLAELARLVGQDDPFRNVFRSTPRPEPEDQRHAAYAEPVQESHDALRDGHWPAEDGYEGHDDAYEDPAYHEAGFEGGTSADPTHYASHDAYAADQAADERYYAASLAAHPDEAGIADQHAAPEAAHDAMTAIPDLWARDDGRVDGYAPEIDTGSHREQPGAGGSAERASARRPIAVLAAVLLLTGGGLAATFLAKGNSGHAVVVSDRGGAPTILAATGPTKVKLDDASTTAPEDQDAALLNKNGKQAAGPVKVVSSEEQPVDLAQLPKSPDVADGAQPLPQASSPFPEPKKVKTFLVHLDGTTLDEPQATASRSAAAPPALSATDVAAPLPATPRTAAKGSATPKTMTIASLTTDPASTDTAAPTPAKSTARQPASPGAHQVAKVDAGKPTEVADASASGFGLQLAASPSESDAEAAFAKLKKKYPAQLGPYTASIHKSETGDKPVYRVRVGGLSQTDAKSLCSQLQSSGGSCFVVHN